MNYYSNYNDTDWELLLSDNLVKVRRTQLTTKLYISISNNCFSFVLNRSSYNLFFIFKSDMLVEEEKTDNLWEKKVYGHKNNFNLFMKLSKYQDRLNEICKFQISSKTLNDFTN